MDIFRVHRMLDDPTIFNRGGKGRAINSSNIGYTTVNRGGRAAFLITPAPQVQVFFLPSLLFILTIPQCQRISVIYYNSPANSPVTASAPEITFRSKFVPPRSTPSTCLTSNKIWNEFRRPFRPPPCLPRPNNCLKTARIYARIVPLIQTPLSVPDGDGFGNGEEEGENERELIVINSLGTSALCAANDKLGNLGVISRIWTTWTERNESRGTTPVSLWIISFFSTFSKCFSYIIAIESIIFTL